MLGTQLGDACRAVGIVKRHHLIRHLVLSGIEGSVGTPDVVDPGGARKFGSGTTAETREVECARIGEAVAVEVPITPINPGGVGMTDVDDGSMRCEVDHDVTPVERDFVEASQVTALPIMVR